MTDDFAEIDALIDQLAQDGEISPGTRADNESRWAVFQRWCDSKRVNALPADPATVAAFYAAMANGTSSDHGEPCAQSSLKIMRYVIGWKHREAGYEVLPTKDESVRAAYRGISKTLAPAQSATPVLPDDMRRIQAASVPMNVQRLQDYVLVVLSLGTGSAIRELADIRVVDVDADVVPGEVGGSVLIRDFEGGALAEFRCQCDTDVICDAHLTAYLREEAASHSTWLFPFFGTRGGGLQVRGSDGRTQKRCLDSRLRAFSQRHSIVMKGGLVLWETDDEEERARILRDLSPDHIGPRFVRIRDQVMALVAWHAALRSSEYRALRASDLERTEGGYLVTVRRSKTDQFGNGEIKSLVPAKDPVLCPVRALDRWLALTGLEGEDFLFPTIFRGTAIGDRGLNSRQAVNFNLRRLGEDASVPGLTGHSFRTGFGATSRQQGKSTEETMTATGHRDYDTATIYERSAPLGADPLRGLGA